MTQHPISCELHDYLEIACLYGYQVRLTLKDQQILEGQAIDTMTSPEKREYRRIEDKQIELNQIKKLQVLTPKAKFQEIVFCGWRSAECSSYHSRPCFRSISRPIGIKPRQRCAKSAA
ncbi:Rho-binding antiterminator [Methylomonas sp. OY6]|uniref:Rho-binding antiterminator n=1 Tax=Methylomonas defluvii TaxID=3045149 RepID=A0ABU4UG28_9GAMM|nr:Rho-binding antiterminator [Methylomonas sp. OY6]MDX8127842.1 Rho-binding antiterminator [Methylomonas sp. OY6]